MKINKHFLELNLAVVCISTSGILGRLVTMAPEVTIFWRCILALLLIGSFIAFAKISIKIKSKKDLYLIFAGGFLMAVHWVSYFYSLSLANIAVAILTLHSFPAFTAILEPLILKTKFRAYHFLLAGLVILGVWIILPSHDLGNHTVLATVFGLISGLAYALRNIFTRKVIQKYHGSSMMFFQLIIMSILLLPFVFIHDSQKLLTEWPYVGLLALVTTAIGHTLFVKNLKHYSAITVSLISSIVPVYGILWGVFFLDEIPQSKTLIGGGLILMSFIIESLMSANSSSTD